MANTKLNRTAGSTGNRRTWTFSAWVKRSAVKGTADSKGGLFSTYTDGNNRLDFGIDANDRFFFKEKESSSTLIDFTSHRTFQDPASFYNFVIAVDTTQVTEANRIKIYCNNEQITSWLDSTYPSVNRDTLMNVSGRTYIIGSTDGSSNYWNGVMSHVNFSDGYAYTPSTFGSTDTNGNWKINTAPSITMGTNGFSILKDGDTITDQSTNSNDFTLGGGTLTKTLDCPSNNFATWNVLAPQGNNRTMGNGNTYIGVNSNNSWNCLYATLAPTSGKFYCEIKDESDWGSTSDSTRRYGIVDLNASIDMNRASATDVRFSDHNYAYAYMNASGVRHSGSTLSGTTSTHPTFAEGNIIMIAMDLDNHKLYFGKNGTWNNSADPTSGATGTGSVANIDADGMWTFYAETKYGSDNASANFGNGFHRTTAVTTNSGNGYAGAEGKSKFTYQPPTGYSALTTLGMNQ